MSCCFVKKDREDASALAAGDGTPHLQLMDIRTWRDTCNGLQLFLRSFQLMRAFSNMRENFQERPAKKTLAKRLRVQREIEALKCMRATGGSLAGLRPLNRDEKGIRL